MKPKFMDAALAAAEEMDVTYDDCIACEEFGAEEDRGECPESKLDCGHHCNHFTTHDKCCWCGKEQTAEDDDYEHWDIADIDQI